MFYCAWQTSRCELLFNRAIIALQSIYKLNLFQSRRQIKNCIKRFVETRSPRFLSGLMSTHQGRRQLQKTEDNKQFGLSMSGSSDFSIVFVRNNKVGSLIECVCFHHTITLFFPLTNCLVVLGCVFQMYTSTDFNSSV